MLDPMFQRVGVAVLARVGHFFDGEQFHLPLVIERRADLQLRGRLAADAAGEIIQAGACARASEPAVRARGASGLATFDWRRASACRVASVALVMMTLVSVSNSRRRRNSATSTGAAFSDEIALRLAAAFHPIDVVVRLLAQKFRDFHLQFAQPPVALDQFLADFLVVARFDEFAHGLAQALDGQGHVVFHQFRAADAQFLPFAPAGGTAFAAGKSRFRLA